MVWFKRIGLFILTNFLVIMTLSVLLNLLGVGHYMDARGLNLNINSLLIFCLVWGMGGAFISLALSRIMAKLMMGVKVIDPKSQTPYERQLLDMVYRLSRSAGLTTMPEVGVYESPDINAFATGPTKSRALVAVSSGLLTSMGKNEVEGVIGHEISHVANGDMVTMTLLQGVVNAFVMFLARILAFAVSQALRGDRDERGRGSSYFVQYLLVWVFEIFFMILGSLIVSWFSRYREFRADAGGARLAGRENMVAALRSLQKWVENPHQVTESTNGALKTLKISGGQGGILRYFSSHPSLEERIQRLQMGPR